MKLSAVSTKLTCITKSIGIKSGALRVLAAATLAGAVLTAAAPAAQAQHVSFGVSVGGPRYIAPPPVAYGYAPGYYGYAPGYYGRGFEARRAHEEWLRREEFRRHQEWERYHHGYDHPYYGR